MNNIKDFRSYSKNLLLRKYIPIYTPAKKRTPPNLLVGFSAWRGLDEIIEDILDRFKIPRQSCSEFGVEYGYSTVAFSNFFEQVTGIDTFEGDIHSGVKGNHFEATKARLAEYKNIALQKYDYRDWIAKDTNHYNFAHVDIIHTYKETYECGLWAATHSDCTIFHDTVSYPEVRQAVIDIAKTTGHKIYNYPYCYGLGILVKV